MEFNEYQQKAGKTAIYAESINNYVDSLEIPNKEKAESLKQMLRVSYTLFGLASEAGEACGVMKKAIRDSNLDWRAKLGLIDAENGDTLWYSSQLAKECQYDFENIAQENLEKLASREKRGVLGGSGDYR